MAGRECSGKRSLSAQATCLRHGSQGPVTSVQAEGSGSL